MKLAFVSTFLNHHQRLLCEELRSRCDEFCYLATAPVPQERMDFGYEDINLKYSYVVRTYDGSTSEDRINDIILNSDVVIFGECANRYIEMRMQENKLSFLFSERFFKKGVWRRFIPMVRRKVDDRVIKHKDKRLYVLSASGFLPRDLSLCGFESDKCYRWGYFPEVKEYSEYPARNNSKLNILWAGRFISWKRADTAIVAAAKLKARGVDFTLNIVGSGPLEESLRTLTAKKGLSDYVRFLGSMTPDMVKTQMEQADIFIVSSDFREGWGAVVNEAMSAGCAVLASSAVGSVPFLIESGKNGLVYRYGNMRDMCDKLYTLSQDAALRRTLGLAAFDTIRNEYSASVAAERFVRIASTCCDNSVSYPSGPMSKAPVIKNNWCK